ncbi:MAG: anti-sigma factor family protein [Candidatus Caldatribacteriaceae bacterium]
MAKRFSLCGDDGMDCERVKQRLSLYIDEEVLPEERRDIQEHLLQCTSCQREMQKLLVVKKLLRTLDRNFEAGFRREKTLDFQVALRGVRRQKLALVFLFSAVTVASLLAFAFWRGVQKGTDLQKEIAPVSTLAGFDSRLEKSHFIQVVEFTLDR